MALISVRSTRGRPAAPRVRLPSERKSLSRTATRALDVLECFGAERRRLRAIEIANRLGLSGSTANQLLKTMVDSAHLVFDAQDKTYFPSPRLVGFCGLMAATYGVEERLRLLVEDVSARTGLSITVTTPNDLFMQILYVAARPEQSTERGLKVEVFGSAIGSAFLSTLPDARLRALARRARIGPDNIPALLAAAAQVRRDGYADGKAPGETYWTIAMPLPRDGSPTPMVFAVSGPLAAVQARSCELRDLMREAIHRWLA
jgi:DNA-binding IclR family transcriptional regulator